MQRRAFLMMSTGSLFALATTRVHAQTYPNRPVVIVVPWPAGGNADVTTRIVAEKLSLAFGQPFVVENRPGAGGNLGLAAVANAAPDGYTLLSLASANAVNGTFFPNLPFNFESDFTPVGMMTTNPLVMAVPATFPAESVQDFISYARKNPEKMNYASGGPGSTSHLTAELFKMNTGVQMKHIPYSGGAPAVTDLIGGRVQLFFDSLLSSLPHWKAGKLKILAVTTETRSNLIPSVPTMTEAGLTGFDVSLWLGLLAPTGVRPEIVSRLNRELNNVLNDEGVQHRFNALGSSSQPGDTEQFGKYVKAALARWKDVIKAASIQFH